MYGTANGSTGNGSSLATPESIIVVKVSSPVKGDVMYKSIMVGNSDHTPKVLALALEKLGFEDEDPKNFSLVQVLPHKELKFPANANVFYALDTSVRSGGGDIRLEVRPITSLIKMNHSNNNNNNNNNSISNPYGKNSLSQHSTRSS